MTLTRKWLAVIAALYVAAGITTALALKEVHYQVCTPHGPLAYVLMGAVWPAAGALMVAIPGHHAPSFCGWGARG